MWTFRHIRYLCGPVLFLFWTWAGMLSPSWAQPKNTSDPVEDLRRTLLEEDPRVPNAFQQEHRRKKLDEKIDALKTISDLRRALALEEWKEDPGQGRAEPFRLIDEQKRRLVGTKLQEAIKYVVAKGQPNSRLAVANLISEMGPSVRALDIEDRKGFARSLTPQVIQLVDDQDTGVRHEALRALGTINADPSQAVPIFQKVLQKGTPDGRVLAARGLGQMMLVVNQLKKRGQTVTRVEATEKDVLETALAILPPFRLGLNDPDHQVRIACLGGVQAVGQGLVDLINEPFPRKNFPPEGRQLTEEETRDILATYEQVRKEFSDVQSLFALLKENTPHLIPALTNADPNLRLAGIYALETVSWARLKQKRRLESVPLPSSALGKTDPIKFEDPLESFLTKGLSPASKLLADPDVRIRRSTVDFMENLEEAALPALPALIEALHDSDRFVRWGVTRVLAGLPPEKAQPAVPALARLLNDNDLDIRKSAAYTLEGMGPLAKGALPALPQALLEGDVEGRLAVLAVLGRLLPEDAKAAIPQLVALLANKDTRLRKASAETLARLGSLARPAIPALRNLLGDDDADVRQAASDAFLNILVRSKE